MIATEPTVDCQTCGEVIRRLTPAEARRVADRPYDFVVNCGPCGRAEARRIERT